jgi:hypothetical protein
VELCGGDSQTQRELQGYGNGVLFKKKAAQSMDSFYLVCYYYYLIISNYVLQKQLRPLVGFEII